MIEPTDMIDAARQDALFPKLTAEQIACLLPHGDELRLEAGEVLFAEGKPASAFYVVLEGEVKITKRVGDEEATLTVHEAGKFTGELSLLMTPDLAASPPVARSERAGCCGSGRTPFGA